MGLFTEGYSQGRCKQRGRAWGGRGNCLCCRCCLHSFLFQDDTPLVALSRAELGWAKGRLTSQWGGAGDIMEVKISGEQFSSLVAVLQFFWQTFSDDKVILTHLYSLWIDSYIQFRGWLGSDSRCFLLAWYEMLGMPHQHVEGLTALLLCDWWLQIFLWRLQLRDTSLVLGAGNALVIPWGF